MEKPMEDGPVLRLLLKDIKAHEDEQIERLRRENKELKALRNDLNDADRWERYSDMIPHHAHREIVNANKQKRYEQDLDLIAAEG